jgi:hypothetical protein
LNAIIECIIWFLFHDTLYIERQLTDVIIAPHAGFSIRDPAAGRDVIPAVGTVIDGM